MAKVYLDSGENFALSGPATVYGSAGTEKVTVNTGVTGVEVNANVERVDLAGASSTYTFQQVGNQLKVFSGTTLVANVQLQDDTNGTQVVFSNGSVEAKVGATGLTLGGAVVPSAAAAAVTPTTIDATVTTGSGAAAGGTVTGQPFTLTSATTSDIPQLTTGNDTITGAAGTLNTYDVLADSSTTDSDTLTAILNTSLTTAPTISNVENISLDFKGFGLKFNAGSTSNGAITVSSTQDGNTTATLQNVGATTKLAVGAGITTLSLESSAATLNLTGGQTLTVNNGSATAVSGTMAFVSAGSSANTITYEANDSGATTLKSLAVSGSQSLTIKTADVSDFAGNTVTKSLSGTAKLTLEIGVTSAAGSDLSKVAADSFNVNVSGSQSLSLASGANVTLSKDVNATGTLAIKTDSASDTLNLTVKAAQASALTLDKFETVNLAVSTATPVTLAGLTVTDAATAASRATTINLTGSQDVTITALNGLAAASTTLNAGDFGAKLTATIGATAATVVGGASADSITGGTSADVIVGGAGADTLISGGTNGDTVNDTIIGGAGNDVVNLGTANTSLIIVGTSASINGGDGTDTLDFSSTSPTTLTGKVIAFENVTVRATVGAVGWTIADSDVSTGSTLVFELVAGTATDVLTFNGAAETDASFNIKVTNNAINVITGGALADSISVLGSSKANTITAGKGADIITLSNTTTNGDVLKFAAGDSGVTIATADVINGAGATDVLKFTSITATAETSALATGSQLGTGWSVATTGIATKTNATLDDFITAATAAAKAGATGMNGQAVAFISGADTYVFAAGTNTAANTDDGLVKLTGLVIADLSTGAYAAAGEFILS